MKIDYIIDEAPFKPEYWRYICDHISSVSGGEVCLISRSGAKPQRNRVVSSSVMGGDRLLTVDTSASAFVKKLISSSHGGFVRDVDVLTSTEMEDDPYRKHVLQPIGCTETVFT